MEYPSGNFGSNVKIKMVWLIFVCSAFFYKARGSTILSSDWFKFTTCSRVNFDDDLYKDCIKNLEVINQVNRFAKSK